MKKTSENIGSAVVEMTFLIPVILGIIYMYIMLFLFLIESAKYREIMVESLYSIENENGEKAVDSNENGAVSGVMEKSQHGSKISVYIKEQTKLFDIELEMHRKEDSAVQNIRRWQLAADTFRTGENE